MKIRNGYVSNSSSSSFILKLDTIPTTLEETKVLLYGENPPLLTAHWDDDAISTTQVARILLNDIESSHFMDINDIISDIREEVYFSEYSGEEGRDFVVGTEYIEEFDRIYHNAIQKDKDFHKSRWDKSYDEVNWEKHDDEMKILCEPLYDIMERCIREKYDDSSKFIKVEYSDNDGMVFSYLEHGGVLDKITVQRFSHH
jgi:hypothetical protein